MRNQVSVTVTSKVDENIKLDFTLNNSRVLSCDHLSDDIADGIMNVSNIDVNK